eukprot:TRINITY_DN1277_c0_g1_i13.p1 TRINITY_DN1277_c0_g1~~TRINITY_DN1277_c0_g1_i13.p1  ORF type:complete len:303 (+),score=47.84 TRINITY_DN1277_c0_g1_i13:217-1125(+)
MSTETTSAQIKAKMVIVGDGTVGKTCLLDRFTKAGWEGGMETIYNPTSFEEQSIGLILDAEDGSEFHHFAEGEDMEEDKFTLELWDTAGQEIMAKLRELAYPHTHCFLFAYDTTKRFTLENVEVSWIPEVEKHCTHEQRRVRPHRILVGTKSDLKDEENVDHVTYEEGYEVAKKIKADAFIETSALTKHNVRELQALVIQAAKAHKTKAWLPFKLTDFAAAPTNIAAVTVDEPAGRETFPNQESVPQAVTDANTSTQPGSPTSAPALPTSAQRDHSATAEPAPCPTNEKESAKDSGGCCVIC